MSRRALAAAAALVAIASAGCTSAAGGQDTSAPASTPGPDHSSTSAPASAAPTVTASPSSTVPASSSSPAATTSSSPGPVTVKVPVSTAPRSTCTALTARVIRGSADRGREFAALQFTNDGPSGCTLYGYPTVTLLRHGKQIGTSSQPASDASSTFVLAPGDTAESQLDDYTNCQAPLSDTIRVVVPGSSQTVSRPGELRACTLRVSRLGKPD